MSIKVKEHTFLQKIFHKFEISSEDKIAKLLKNCRSEEEVDITMTKSGLKIARTEKIPLRDYDAILKYQEESLQYIKNVGMQIDGTLFLDDKNQILLVYIPGEQDVNINGKICPVDFASKLVCMNINGEFRTMCAGQAV